MTAPTLAAKCTEPWCTNHYEDEAGAMHATADVRLLMTAGGPAERGTIAVAAERDDDEDGVPGPSKVRLELRQPLDDEAFHGIHGGVLTPGEALQLAYALEKAARTAMAVQR